MYININYGVSVDFVLDLVGIRTQSASCHAATPPCSHVCKKVALAPFVLTT